MKGFLIAIPISVGLWLLIFQAILAAAPRPAQVEWVAGDLQTNVTRVNRCTFIQWMANGRPKRVLVDDQGDCRKETGQ